LEAACLLKFGLIAKLWVVGIIEDLLYETLQGAGKDSSTDSQMSLVSRTAIILGFASGTILFWLLVEMVYPSAESKFRATGTTLI